MKNNKMTKNAKTKKPIFEDAVSDDGSISLPCTEGKSLEQTLKACGVDESKWSVDHYTIEENTRGYNFKVYLIGSAGMKNILDLFLSFFW
jgi:hypothetical protein